MLHVRICAGGDEKSPSLPQPHVKAKLLPLDPESLLRPFPFNGFSTTMGKEPIMPDTPNMLDRAFDLLSSFPYINLKALCKRMWWFQLFLIPLVVFIGYMSVGTNIFTAPQTLKMFPIYGVGIVTFRYMFWLWDRRDAERKLSINSKGPF